MNRFKKIIAVGMLLLLMVGILAGCNADELRYWDQSVRLYKLGLETDTYTSAVIRFNFDVKSLLEKETDQEELKKMMPIINLMEKGYFKYDIAQSIKDDKQDIKISAKVDPAAEYVPYFEIIRLNKVNYIKVAPIKSFIETYLAEEADAIKFINAIPKDVAYIEMSDESLVSDLNDSSLANPFGISYTKEMMSLSSSEDAKKTEPFIQLFDQLIRKGYDNYSMDIIRQDGNTFKMTMKFNELGQLITNLLNYTLDNSDKIQSTLFDGLRQIPASTLATMVAAEELTDADKNKAIDDMQVMAKEMLKDTAGLKEELNASIEDTNKQLIDMFGDSKMTVDMEILDTNTVSQSINLMLDMKDPTTSEKFKMDITGNGTTKFNATLNIEKPEGKSMTLTELESLMPKRYTLYPYDAYMTVNSGFGSTDEDLDVIIDEGTAYIYADQLELFTEDEVNINDETGFAEVKTANGKVELPLSDDGMDYYIKVKDLEKLGFNVKWNVEESTIEVTK